MPTKSDQSSESQRSPSLVTYEIVWKDRQPDDDLFPHGIDWDQSLVFHGTSSTREESIDVCGLRPNSGGVTIEQVRSIVKCFDFLGWRGENISGYSTLRAWTLRNDFRDGEVSPLYLSHHASQALCFAGPTYCGGEKLASCRRALADLRRFVDDAEYQATAIANEDQWLDTKAAPNASASSLEEVRSQLSGLADLFAKGHAERESYRYAVVYAIRPPMEVKSKWEDCKGMGLRVLEPIPREWLVAKLRVHPPTKP